MAAPFVSTKPLSAALAAEEVALVAAVVEVTGLPAAAEEGTEEEEGAMVWSHNECSVVMC